MMAELDNEAMDNWYLNTVTNTVAPCLEDSSRLES